MSDDLVVSEVTIEPKMKPWSLRLSKENDLLLVTIRGYKGSLKARFYISKGEFFEAVDQFKFDY